jgi:hypothetical protein
MCLLFVCTRLLDFVGESEGCKVSCIALWYKVKVIIKMCVDRLDK